MKWVGFLRSQLGSAWSWLQPYSLGFGQLLNARLPVWLLILLWGALVALTFWWQKKPVATSPGASTAPCLCTDDVDGRTGTYSRDVSVANAKLEGNSKNVLKHQRNRDSARHALSKSTAAVDSLSDDELQSMLDRLYPATSRQP